MDLPSVLTVFVLLLSSSILGELLDISSCSFDWSSNRMMQVHCNISEGNTWNFSEIRNWANNQTLSNFELYIQCHTSGEIILRRPIKASLMTKLHIQSCFIIRSEYTDLSLELYHMNYSIQKLIIEDSIYVHTNTEIWRFYVDTYEENKYMYHCEYPPSLQHLKLRNVSHIFRKDKRFTHEEYALLVKRINNYSRGVDRCSYNSLQYLELSNIQEDAKLQIDNIISNGAFPQLKTLNISSLALSSTPQEFLQISWYTDFPALEVIDLSFNNLRTFDFRIPPPDGRRLTIDLFHNDISIMDSQGVQSIMSIYPALINITNNPFVCNCSQKHFVTFLNNGSFPKYHDNLGNAKCSAPTSTIGRTLKSLQISDICDIVHTEMPNFMLFIGLPLLIVSFIIVLLTVKFRRDIRVLVFTRCTSQKYPRKSLKQANAHNSVEVSFLGISQEES